MKQIINNVVKKKCNKILVPLVTVSWYVIIFTPNTLTVLYTVFVLYLLSIVGFTVLEKLLFL